MNKKLEKAIEVFNNGGIVIFPTDTAIGIGCRIDNKETIKRLFEIRKRPESKPLLILVNSVEMAEKYLLPIPQKVKDELIEKYWPGKLTIVMKCIPDKVPFPVRSKKNTLGVRFPDNKILLELIGKIGVPIVAPSANFSGEDTPFSFEDIDKELIKKVDFVLDEKLASERELSTVIDVTVEPWKIIRKGAVKI
jgi:L-threonylcarbamoyladenylate synthase